MLTEQEKGIAYCLGDKYADYICSSKNHRYKIVSALDKEFMFVTESACVEVTTNKGIEAFLSVEVRASDWIGRYIRNDAIGTVTEMTQYVSARLPAAETPLYQMQLLVLGCQGDISIDGKCVSKGAISAYNDIVLIDGDILKSLKKFPTGYVAVDALGEVYALNKKMEIVNSEARIIGKNFEITLLKDGSLVLRVDTGKTSVDYVIQGVGTYNRILAKMAGAEYSVPHSFIVLRDDVEYDVCVEDDEVKDLCLSGIKEAE